MKENDDVHLKGFPKEHGFSTPPRYFEQLPTRVMQLTAGAPRVEAPAKWFRRFKPALAGTAMAVVFAVSFLATHTLEMAQQNTSSDLAKITQIDITHYLLNTTELETTELAEYAAVKAPQTLEFLDVRLEDINQDAALEIIEEKEEF